MVESREGVLCSNAVEDERFRAGKSVHALNLRSVICAPIVARDKVLGVIHIDCPIQRRTYNEHHLRLVTAIAYQTGLALENARLVQAQVERERLAAVGGRIDAVFFCPHAPEDHCDCRKPLPGMMFDIAKRYGTDLRQVPMASDTLRDLKAAEAAGCEPHLVCTGRMAGLNESEVREVARQVPGTRVHADLGAMAEHLLRRELGFS